MVQTMKAQVHRVKGFKLYPEDNREPQISMTQDNEIIRFELQKDHFSKESGRERLKVRPVKARSATSARSQGGPVEGRAMRGRKAKKDTWFPSAEAHSSSRMTAPDLSCYKSQMQGTIASK